MTSIGLRFNLDKEEVELTVDDEVALTSGADVFKSWVEAYNTKHPVSIDEPVAPKTVDVETPVVEETGAKNEEVVEPAAEEDSEAKV